MSMRRTLKITGYYLKGDYPKIYGTDVISGMSVSLIVAPEDNSFTRSRFPIGAVITFEIYNPGDWMVIPNE